MKSKNKLVDRDLDLFESINEGKERHLKGSESLPPIKPLTKAYDVAYVRFSVPDLILYSDSDEITDPITIKNLKLKKKICNIYAKILCL